MSFKYSLNAASKIPVTLARFDADLVKLGYTRNPESYSQNLSGISVNQSSEGIVTKNGEFFVTNGDFMRRNYLFNINNEWEYKAAIAIAAIRDSGKFHKGEAVICRADSAEGAYTQNKLYIIKDISSTGIRTTYDNYNSNENGWVSSCFRKATPEEIIAWYKKTPLEKTVVTEQKVIRLSQFKVGQKIKIERRPAAWSSRIVDNNPLDVLKYPVTGIIMAIDPQRTGTSHHAGNIEIEGVRYGFDMNDLVREKNTYIMKESTKKVTGYKLIKEYPGSVKLGHTVNCKTAGSVTIDDCEKFPEFWEPQYAPEDKMLVLGDNKTTVKIIKGAIYAAEKEFKYDELCKLIPFIETNIAGYEVTYDFDMDKRCIRIGCSKFSINEITSVLDAYYEINN